MDRMKRLGCLAVLLCVGTALSAQLESLWEKPKPPVLQVDFSAKPRKGEVPLAVQFSTLIEPGEHPIREWLWEFGDGVLSREREPSHTYLEPGVYSVALTVTDTADSSAGKVLQNYVRAYGKPAKALVKATLATLPTTGLSLGVEMAPGYEKKVRAFFNLEGMTFLSWPYSIGTNVEFRAQPKRGSGFYYSGFLGGEMVWEYTNWFQYEDEEPHEPDFVFRGLIPHVAGGVGYQWEYGDRNWFFVEAKAGVMVFLATLRIGMIF